MPHELPPLDIAALRLRLWSDESMFQEIACAMRDDIVQRGLRLREAAQQHDAATAKHEAHALKGGLASVTAQVAAALAGELEHMAKAEQWTGFDEKLAQLMAVLHEVQTLLEHHITPA